MKVTKKLIYPALMVLSFGALSGCGGGGGNVNGDNNGPVSRNSSNNPDGAIAITKQIDASAGGRGAASDDPANKYAYFDLDTGEVINLTDADAETNSDWDIAFKRTNFKLNGGVSGPGIVKGSVADDQDDFYDEAGDANSSVFLNATAQSELSSFDAVVDFSGLTFEEDRNIPYIKGDGSSEGWWLYAGSPTYAVSANPDRWWLIKSAAADSYAKFRVTDIVQASRDITLELFIQGVSGSAFAATPTPWIAAIGAAGGSKCFDIDTAAEVGCTTAATDWDIKVEVAGQSWNIWTNAGVSGSGSGGAFGSFDNTTIANYLSGTINTSGTDLRRMYGSDSAGGTFKDNTWYAYSLQKKNKLWPNFRVYAVDTGTAQYKLQILSFYDDAGTSGMIKFRYERL